MLESLFPRHLWEQLLGQLEQHRRLLLLGPTGVGKSSIGRLLAKYQLMRMGHPDGGSKLLEIRFPPAITDNDGPETVQKCQQVGVLLGFNLI